MSIQLSVYYDPTQGTYRLPEGTYMEPKFSAPIRTARELRTAIREDNFKEALDIVANLDQNALNEPGMHEHTALHWAALCDHKELCKALLEKMDETGILHQTETNHQTALHFAARKNSKNFVKIFKELKPELFKKNAEIEDGLNQTPLHYGIDEINIEVCEELYPVMETEKIILPVGSDDKEPLLQSVVRKKNLQLVNFLLKRNDVAIKLTEQVDAFGQTALHWAAGLGELDICNALYVPFKAAGALANKTKTHEYSALVLAVHMKKPELIEVFTKDAKQGDPLLGQVDKYGQTPLHWAASLGCEEICKMLLPKMTSDQICKPMSPAERRQTALHFAVQGGHRNVVELFLSRDDCASRLSGMQDHFGQTALHWAVGKGEEEICDILYSKMAIDDVCLVTNKQKQTALHLAAEKGYTNIVRILLSRKDVRERLSSQKNAAGETPLDLAKRHQFSEIEKLLTIS